MPRYCADGIGWVNGPNPKYASKTGRKRANRDDFTDDEWAARQRAQKRKYAENRKRKRAQQKLASTQKTRKKIATSDKLAKNRKDKRAQAKLRTAQAKLRSQAVEQMRAQLPARFGSTRDYPNLRY